MFVKSVMIEKNQCHTVSIDDSVKVGLTLLEEYELDALPVLDGEKYAGILTRFQVYKQFFENEGDKASYLVNTKAKDIMIHADRYVDEEEVFEKTLLLLKDIPLVAVVGDNRRFLGIVTRSEGLTQFQSAFGINRPGVRIAFTSVETEGRIARLAEITKQFHENIISLTTFDETDKLVRRIIMKVEKKDNLQRFLQKLEQSGFRILDIKED